VERTSSLRAVPVINALAPLQSCKVHFICNPFHCCQRHPPRHSTGGPLSRSASRFSAHKSCCSRFFTSTFTGQRKLIWKMPSNQKHLHRGRPDRALINDVDVAGPGKNDPSFPCARELAAFFRFLHTSLSRPRKELNLFV
jgi:hypothetical protein